MSKQGYLVFSASSEGGLAEHIYYQARALQQEGQGVCLLTPKVFLPDKFKTFSVIPVLRSMPHRISPLLLKRITQVWVLCINYYLLAYYILKKKPAIVLIDSYREYLAAIWAWPVKVALHITKSVCVVNLHDPVRDYVIGPIWWHNWSVKCGYSFIDIGLVHAKISEKAQVPPHVRIIEVPVGIYDLPESTVSSDKVRQGWLANNDHKIFLSFGYIRDNKNIDLLLAALTKVENAFLVIAGKPQSLNDKPMSFYQNLADQLKVSDRCFFYNDFIPENELGNFFRSVDFVALTYSSTFHSQSGVLNLAAASRLRVLASGADSPLIRSVEKYRLGEVVVPDSVEAIIMGMNKLFQCTSPPDWDGYYQYAGWDTNVKRLSQGAFEINKIKNYHGQ